ncbi:MAG: hypothetical protein ACLQDY_21390 [Streptosporangiaceae bacterium]
MLYILPIALVIALGGWLLLIYRAEAHPEWGHHKAAAEQAAAAQAAAVAAAPPGQEGITAGPGQPSGDAGQIEAGTGDGESQAAVPAGRGSGQSG